MIPDDDVILDIQGLGKRYRDGLVALRGVDLSIRRGEIFALLGPNGAGKTTLISVVCGLVNASAGTVRVDGFDNVRDFRQTRSRIGLVPQELAVDAFETVRATVAFSRGLMGRPPDPGHVERVLRQLSLWDKRDAQVRTLSGGMKRRVLIAKALAHEPSLLFLDEPTAGVDVELRHDMWAMVRGLRERGTTVVLTTHYIEEAEEMADRIGVMRRGELVVVEETASLMRRLGSRQLTVVMQSPLPALPPALADLPLSLSDDGVTLTYTFDAQAQSSGIADLLRRLAGQGIDVRDLHTSETSLEDIFVGLVREAAA
ncbi:MAG: ABC transporter ATP-binding protein [Pseudoxanthomonas sp.]|nr:ABC transporter ATP-binding protein [Pseudoxanthomonas sp.]